MTVSELMSLLEECDPDATVRIMSQPSWPFEYAVSGIARRDEFDGECDCGEDDCDGEVKYDPGLSGNDVFIVEGGQERYGDKGARDAVRRW